MPQVGEHGNTFRGDAQYNMEDNTSLIFRFFKPDDTTFTGTAVLGTATVTTADGAVLLANQHASYVFNSGDLDVSGTWDSQLEFEDNVAVLKLKSPRSPKTTFFVGN